MEQSIGDNSVPPGPGSSRSLGKPPVSPASLAGGKTSKRGAAIAKNMRSMFKIPKYRKSSSTSDGSCSDSGYDDSGSGSVGSFDLDGMVVDDSPQKRRKSGSVIGKLFNSKKKPAEADTPTRGNSDNAVSSEAEAKELITEPQDEPRRRMSGGAMVKIFRSKKEPDEAEDKPKRRGSGGGLSKIVNKMKNKSSDTEEKTKSKSSKSRGSETSASCRGERKLGKEIDDDGSTEESPKSRGYGSFSLRGERKLGKEIDDDGSTEESPKSRGYGSSSARGERKLGEEIDDDGLTEKSPKRGYGSSSVRGERKLGEEIDGGSTEKSPKSGPKIGYGSSSVRGERKLGKEIDGGSTEKSPKSRGYGSSSLRGERKLGKEIDGGSTEKSPKSGPKRGYGSSSVRGERKLGKEIDDDGSTAALDKPKKKSTDTDDKPKRRGSAGSVSYKGSKEIKSERGTDDSSTVGAPKPKRNDRIGSPKPKRKATVGSLIGKEDDKSKSSQDGDKTTTTKKKASKNSDKINKSSSDSVSSKDTAGSKESKSEKSEGKKKVRSRRAERTIDEEDEKRQRGNSLGAVNKDKFKKKKKKKKRRSSLDAQEGTAPAMPDLMNMDGETVGTISLNDDDPSSTTQQSALAGDVPIAAGNDGFTSVSNTIKASSLSLDYAKEDPADAVAKPEFIKRPPLRRRSSLGAMDEIRPEMMQKPVRRNSFGTEGDVQQEEEVLASKLKKGKKSKKRENKTSKKDAKRVAFTEDEMGHRWNNQTTVRQEPVPVRGIKRTLSVKEKETLKRDLLFNKLEVVRLRQSLSEALDKAIKYSESQREERKEFAKSNTELMQLKMEHQKTVEERRRLKTDLAIYKDSLDEKDEKIDALTGAVGNQLNKVELLEEELEHAEDDLFKMEDQIREFEEAFPGINGEPPKKSMKNIADDMDRKLEENSRLRRLEEREDRLNLKEKELEAKERMSELKLTTEKDGARSQGEVGDRAPLDDHVNDVLKELSDKNKKLLEELVEEKEKASAQLSLKDGTQDTLLREIDIMKAKFQVMQTQMDSSAEEHNLVVKASDQKMQGLIDENSILTKKLERQKEHTEASEDDFEEQLKEKDTEISDLTTDIEDLQEELAKLQKEKKKGGSDLSEKIASLKKANVSLKEQLEAEQDKSTNSLHDESDVIAMLQTKISRLQLDLVSSKSANTKILESESRLKDKLSSSQTLRDSESDRMQEAVDKLLVEKKTLEEEMKDGRTRTAVSLKTNDATIAELQAEITGLKGAVNELELQKSRFESLQVELDQAKARNTLLDGAIEKSKSLARTDGQKSDQGSLKAEVDEWKSRTSSLEEKMKESASQVADWKRRAQEWEKEAAEWESVATGATAQSAPTAVRAPPAQSLYLAAASAGKQKEEPSKWGAVSLSSIFSRHSDHPRNPAVAPVEDDDDDRVEMLEAQNTALKETLTILQGQLDVKGGE